MLVKVIKYFIPRVLILTLLILIANACKKKEPEVIPDNIAPPFNGIPSILVENYLNRLYIDLVGREPSEEEVERDLSILKKDNTKDSRKELIRKLQTDPNPIGNYKPYLDSYFERLYELWKARLLEGVSDKRLEDWIEHLKEDAVADSMAGDTLSETYQDYKNLKLLKDSQEDYKLGNYNLIEIYRRMLTNPVYNEINMNSFNFIRASFSGLMMRFPTQEEFDKSYQMVEFDKESSLFGIKGTNKEDFISIVINSQEFFEGMIRWSFSTFLAREAKSSEIYDLLPQFKQDLDIPKLHQNILSTDEYAGFK